VYKCIFEALFTSQYFWIGYVNQNFFWRDNYDNECVTKHSAAVFAFLTQFFLFGGELWYFILSLDTHKSITNPFTCYALEENYYMILVYTLSLMTAVALILQGPTVYGLSTDPMIWIQDGLFQYRFLFFYTWLMLIYIYSFYVIWFAYMKLRNGLQSSLEIRRTFINRSITCRSSYHLLYQTLIHCYVESDACGYTLFWTIAIILNLLDELGIQNYVS
jgi:hypothetical protein